MSRVNNFRKKIERAVQWAHKNGIALTSGKWYNEGAVCPIGAYVEKKKGAGHAKRLQTRFQAARDENRFMRSVGEFLGLKAKEVQAFIDGVDCYHSESARAEVDKKYLGFFDLGVKLSDKYVLPKVKTGLKAGNYMQLQSPTEIHILDGLGGCDTCFTRS